MVNGIPSTQMETKFVPKFKRKSQIEPIIKFCISLLNKGTQSCESAQNTKNFEVTAPFSLYLLTHFSATLETGLYVHDIYVCVLLCVCWMFQTPNLCFLFVAPTDELSKRCINRLRFVHDQHLWLNEQEFATFHAGHHIIDFALFSFTGNRTKIIVHA